MRRLEPDPTERVEDRQAGHQQSGEPRPRPGRARGRIRGGALLKRLAVLGIAGALLAGVGLLAGGASKAEALPRGEALSLPGGMIISNFVMPNGKRAYCVEIDMSEPSGRISPVGWVSSLPGRAGVFPVWKNTEGMRQMNYLISTEGQSRDTWTAAGVQLSIWRLRADLGRGNAQLNRTMDQLGGSKQGRDLIAKSNALIKTARKAAKAPVAPKAVKGKLKLSKDSREGRYVVAYPAGTKSLTVKNGAFVKSGRSTLEVSGKSASKAYIDATKPGSTIKVSGKWVAEGTAGYEAKLHVYDSTTSSGVIGQRVAVATGASTAAKLRGNFAAVTVKVPYPTAPPVASSRAQASAEVGGTMRDTLIVKQQPGTEAKVWADAVADFTAYLLPEAGAPKVDDAWEPILGEAYEAQAEDPETGKPIWTTWWANSAGEPLLSADGEKIPSSDSAGAPTAGTAADGTAYPVQETDSDGRPRTDDQGNPLYLTGRDPVLETRRDPVTWTEDELSAMSAQQRCTAQPVYRDGDIAVPKLGEYSTKPAAVRGNGTVHWVERVVAGGKVVHEGKCGLANETTKIGLPGVVTQALPEAVVGEELYDIATVSGTLGKDVDYELRFDAYAAPAEAPDQPVPAADPVCEAENRVFRSERVPVTGVGDYRSPGFTALWEHGTEIWWVETLYANGQQIHRGECGLVNETTRVGRPAVETKAQERAAVGDGITDTAIVSGRLGENAGARWEVTFEGFREHYREEAGPDHVENPEEGDLADAGEGSVRTPVCEPDNRLFSTAAVAVNGPGEFRSEEVTAETEWAGSVWWVETLWLIQGETRTAVHAGECGLPNETTSIVAPEVTTDASGFVVVGDLMRDTAKITGPLSTREGVTHEVVFEGYRGDAARTGTADAVCDASNRLFETDPVAVPVPENGGSGEAVRVVSPEITALPEHGDTVWWVETLRQRGGDEVRELHRGKCGLPHETTTVTTPEVRTESAGTVRVGEEMFDTAIVDGKFSEREDVAYRVTFKAYRYSADGELTCSEETEIVDFEDAEGAAVTGPGAYESKRVKTSKRHVGIGGYVETLTMLVDGEEHVIHVGKCGASSERFEVAASEPPAGVPDEDTPPMLAHTGGLPVLPLLIGGVAFLLLGAGVVVLAARQRSQAMAASTGVGEDTVAIADATPTDETGPEGGARDL
ncbi:MAG: hypothetical protein ACK5LO_16915 [Leucobacter sp.]